MRACVCLQSRCSDHVSDAPSIVLRLKRCISLCGVSARVSLVGARRAVPRRAAPRVATAPHMKQFLDPLHSKCERNYRFSNDAHRLLSTKLFLARGGGTFFCVSWPVLDSTRRRGRGVRATWHRGKKEKKKRQFPFPPSRPAQPSPL